MTTEADLERFFRRRIEPTVFGRAQPAGPDQRPVLVLLGGQQAAGKSAAEEAITAAWPGIVYVTGDAFRKHHRDYDDLAVHDPLAMPERTDDTARWFARRCLDHARGHRLGTEPEDGAYGPRYSLCTEGVFNDPDTAQERAERFAAAGFDVHVVVMGVSEHVSRLSAEERYLRAALGDPLRARWTSPEAHDQAYRTLPQTLARLETLARRPDAPVRSVEVWTRTGPAYRWTHGQPGPHATTHLAAARAQTDPARWLADYRRVRQYAETHQITTGPGTVPRPYLDDPRTRTAWQQLDAHHARLTAEHGRAPSSLTVDERLAALRTQSVDEPAGDVQARLRDLVPQPPQDEPPVVGPSGLQMWV